MQVCIVRKWHGSADNPLNPFSRRYLDSLILDVRGGEGGGCGAVAGCFDTSETVSFMCKNVGIGHGSRGLGYCSFNFDEFGRKPA